MASIPHLMAALLSIWQSAAWIPTRLEKGYIRRAATFDISSTAPSILENCHAINDEGSANDESFIKAMEVPSYYATATSGSAGDTSRHLKARGLEGALSQGPAFVLDDVLTESECQNLIKTCDSLGFGQFQAGKNHHGALQIVVPEALTKRLTALLAPHVDLDDVLQRRLETEGADASVDTRMELVGINRRWRIYRYAPGGVDTFAPHIDAGFGPSSVDDSGRLIWDSSGGDIRSRLSVLFYLNDDFVGGETKFYEPVSESLTEPQLLCAVRPKAGSCLVFPQSVGEEAVAYARQHWPLHEGAPVRAGPSAKYVIRSDILFRVQTDTVDTNDRYVRYDHLVRQTFLPKSTILDKKFMQHVSSLYNPHMGVEHVGLVLYSLLRMIRARHVVEIGAGYTTVFILQALHDTHDETKRIQLLEEAEQCRLLDWPWTVGMGNVPKTPPRLLCVDNCAHQKETATGAAAVARTLGLDDYLEFLKADAFELKLPEQVDVLWCDFGVGPRMQEFCRNAWSCLAPGGYLICHSTLTNQQTRSWLEATRAHKGVDVTGLPAHRYQEVSLLEPHKHYQNSISIFQKMENYEAPLYSEYA